MLPTLHKTEDDDEEFGIVRGQVIIYIYFFFFMSRVFFTIYLLSFQELVVSARQPGGLWSEEDDKCYVHFTEVYV